MSDYSVTSKLEDLKNLVDSAKDGALAFDNGKNSPAKDIRKVLQSIKVEAQSIRNEVMSELKSRPKKVRVKKAEVVE